MKNKEVVAALQQLDPESECIIDIMQFNKHYGKQVKIGDSLVSKGVSSHEIMIDSTYGGCCIHVYLPERAIIANWPK